ncbi:MAG TPA: hypothetical protein VFA45_06745 [Actinomycetes bacterium]|nr:hypothetical protein [Actinomycetes bacterium]
MGADRADGLRSILLNWLHSAIPLDPPPGWLVSLVYGLRPLVAVLAADIPEGRLAGMRCWKGYRRGRVLAKAAQCEDKDIWSIWLELAYG